ncbi:MAG: SEC-C domain-containing protein, partial [Acidobacteria bacterium]|nr:SEC-C domain-containing protein [Acidobacteriota bacterium]
MSAGRNAPCPCGSGKKYKKCCLPASSGRDFDSYADLRMTEGLLVPQLLQFAQSRFGKELIETAHSDFHFGRED